MSSFGKRYEEFSDYVYEHCNREHLAHVHFIVIGLAGMKIFFAQVVISGLLFAPVAWFASSVKTALGDLEIKSGVESTDMYTFINARELSQTLNKECSRDDIGRAQNYIDNIKKNVWKQYKILNNAAMLKNSWRLYNAIDAAQTRADKLNDADYCTLKYTFYSIQDRLRNEHIAKLEETDLIKDFGGFGSSDNIYGVQTKLDLLDIMIEENKKYKDKVGVDIAFKRLNNSFKDSLSDDAKSILNKTEVLMALTVYKSLYKLTQAWLFDKSDIEILKDKVDFEFVDSCQAFHGKYELKETIDGNWHHVSYDTNWLHLKVNMCGNYFVLRDIDTIFEKIVTHELGHHFYYYKDTKAGEFGDICRKSSTVRNSACKDSDFVTDYAQTLSTEDYAEHFMYLFLNLIKNNNKILQKKTDHFAQFYK